MSGTRTIIDFAVGDQGKEMRDALYAEIHDRVMSHIEDKKKEIAQGIFASEEVVSEAHDDEEDDKKLVKKMVKKDCLTKEGIEDTEDEYDEEYDDEEDEEDYEWDDELAEELSQYTVEEIQEFMQTEDFEQLDELSKSTMGSYLQKALSQKMSGSGKKDRVPGMQKAYKNIAYRKTTTK